MIAATGWTAHRARRAGGDGHPRGMHQVANDVSERGRWDFLPAASVGCFSLVVLLFAGVILAVWAQRDVTASSVGLLPSPTVSQVVGAGSGPGLSIESRSGAETTPLPIGVATPITTPIATKETRASAQAPRPPAPVP